MIQTIYLSSKIYDEIVMHSRQGKPDEICGILRGRGTTAYELIRARNIAEDKVNNYTVDPASLLLQFEFEETGDEMMGIYHSHPVSVAYPSATDAWNAGYPDAYYLICSLENDDAPEIRCFSMVWQFLEPDWRAIRQSLTFYETRPGLFAYFVTVDASVPDVLTGELADLQRPYYLVYHLPDQDESQFEGRIITVAEHMLQIAEA